MSHVTPIAGLHPLASTRGGPGGTPAGPPPAFTAVPAQPSAPAMRGDEMEPADGPTSRREAAAEATWSTLFGATEVGGTPYAVAVSGDVAYLGGDFTGVMAGMPQDTYLRIARWDGSAWSPLGRGLDGTVRAIALSGSDVFVGGEFAIAGGTVNASRLARWDGERWSDVGGGVTLSGAPSQALVRALATDGRTLYVAGTFDRAGRGTGAVAASGLAAYDLASKTWSALGDGLTSLGSPGQGRALLLDGERLYVGGYFDVAGGQDTASLACISTSTGEWTTFGSGIRDGEYMAQVESLALDPETHAVFVGGSFTRADTVDASGVVRLEHERFTALGEFTFYGNASTASVKALAISGGRLYAGGEFTTAGNSSAPRWVSLDLTAGGDEPEWSSPAPVDNVVEALAAYRDGCVVAGGFVGSDATRIVHAGIWTGSAWQTFGQGVECDPYADGNVFAIVADGTGAYVGGYFDQAGPVRVGSVARWTGPGNGPGTGPGSGQGWDDLAGGVAGANGLGKICAMTRLGQDLYVTGDFASAGGVAASNIARWDGLSWSAVGSGLNGVGYALAVLGGALYAGGAFSAAGTATASGVARWDPATATWTALGNSPVYDDDVFGLAAIDDRYLVIGGEFNAFRRNRADLVRGLNGMVLFDTQAAIDPTIPTSGYFSIAGTKRASGTGMVRALQTLGGKLYIGGWFDTAGVTELTSPQETGFAAQNLAVWDYSGTGLWSPLSTSTTSGGTDQQVQALATLDGERLIVGGWFSVAGPTQAGGVAEFDPATSTWTTYGAGLGGGLRGTCRCEALAQSPDSGLWVGGTFNTAGGKPGCSIALWGGTAGHTS